MFIVMMSHVEQFLKTCKSERTAESYRLVLEKLVAYLSENGRTTGSIDQTAFYDFLSRHPEWGPASRYFAYNVARSFLSWRLGVDHPLSKMRMKRPKSKPQPTITQEQFNKILEFFNTMTPIGARDLALFTLAAETGLRASALCNLKMRDLHLGALSLVALDKGRDGGKWRVCKFSPLVASFLASWLAHRQSIALPDTDTVFCSVYGRKKGMPNDRFGLLSRCREISRKLGFDFTPHVLRRFMATRFLELDASTITTMKQGGWENETEFKRYIQQYQLQDVEKFSPVVEFYKGR